MGKYHCIIPSKQLLKLRLMRNVSPSFLKTVLHQIKYQIYIIFSQLTLKEILLKFITKIFNQYYLNQLKTQSQC